MGSFYQRIFGILCLLDLDLGKCAPTCRQPLFDILNARRRYAVMDLSQLVIRQYQRTMPSDQLLCQALLTLVPVILVLLHVVLLPS